MILSGLIPCKPHDPVQTLFLFLLVMRSPEGTLQKESAALYRSALKCEYAPCGGYPRHGNTQFTRASVYFRLCVSLRSAGVRGASCPDTAAAANRSCPFTHLYKPIAIQFHYTTKNSRTQVFFQDRKKIGEAETSPIFLFTIQISASCAEASLRRYRLQGAGRQQQHRA